MIRPQDLLQLNGYRTPEPGHYCQQCEHFRYARSGWYSYCSLVLSYSTLCSTAPAAVDPYGTCDQFHPYEETQ